MYRYFGGPVPGNACGLHADIGMLTLSPGADIPGLTVLDSAGCDWIDAELGAPSSVPLVQPISLLVPSQAPSAGECRCNGGDLQLTPWRRAVLRSLPRRNDGAVVRWSRHRATPLRQRGSSDRRPAAGDTSFPTLISRVAGKLEGHSSSADPPPRAPGAHVRTLRRHTGGCRGRPRIPASSLGTLTRFSSARLATSSSCTRARPPTQRLHRWSLALWSPRCLAAGPGADRGSQKWMAVAWCARGVPSFDASEYYTEVPQYE
jgi:hypothetical protein